jgi:methyl-accepting chemotaxis protein
MQFIENLKLHQKLLLLVFLPILIMLAFGLYQSYQLNKVRVESSQLQTMVEFSVFASNLVHEMQKERGMTAGFLGSKGSKFASEIQQQRRNTDEKLKQLRDFLKQFDARSISSEFADELNQALDKFSALAQTRESVNNLNISLGDALAYYTGINKSLLGLIADMSKLATNKDIAIMVAAYANFLQGKERAGIERAVLANTFSKDQFTGKLFHKFLSLVTTQQNYQDVFLSLARPQDAEFLTRILTGDTINETRRMRQIAMDKAQNGGFGIDPAYWFKMQTGKINVLKKVEDHLAASLGATAQAIHSKANFDLLFTLLVSLAGVLFSILLSVSISKNLRRQIGGEPGDIERIANQIADGQLQQDSAHEHLTGIHAAIVSMQQKLSQVITRDIQNIVNAARDGDLSQRIELSDKSGFYRSLSEGMNDLVAASESIIQDTGQVFAALSRGDLEHKIENDYRGSFDRLKQDANATIDKLKQVIQHDIQQLVDAAANGDLSQRIDLSDKQGFFEDMSAGINQLLDSIESIFNEASSSMRAIADGDLTHPLTSRYSGQFEDLKDNINSTIRKLDQTIIGLRDSSSIISSTASEISDGNNSLSARTEHQASALEQTAASMEQLTSTVKNNADNTHQADQLADNARQTALKGGEVMQQASVAMEEINQSSQKIAEIIGVIDEIAFQTNLLALNASVEAARAGEQGRGFAVVATEVRNLAGRSATAAREIKELINDSVSKVEVGVQLVEQSTRNQQEIVESINRVGSIIGEISTASHEQSDGIEQINVAITSMDDTTQQNAALAEQTSAAAISLSEQTVEMSDMLEFFRVSAVSATSPSARSPAKPNFSASSGSGYPAKTGAQVSKPTSPVARPPASAQPALAAEPSFDDDEWEEF